MINVTQIGYNFINFGGIDVQRPEGEDQYLLLFFRTDTEVMMDGVYQTVKKFSFFIYPKGTPQYYRKTDGDYLNDWMYFDIKPDNEYFKKLNIPLCTPISLRSSAALNTMMLEMFDDCFHENAQNSIMLGDKANSFFHRLSVSYALELSGSGKRNIYHNELNDLRNKLLNFSFIPQSNESIAKSLNISVSRLEHLYKELFNTTIIHDMIRGRIQNACLLLRSTDYTVTNIATICGYDNPEHFSKQFKSIVGCSPRQYRQKRIEKL